jgi:hypothetical protein
MRNAEQIRKRLDEVKSMKSYTEALSTLADIQYDIGMDACHERHILQTEVTKLRALIVGNGDPENSVVSRLRNMEDCVETFGDKIDKISDALLGTMDGEKGLFYRIGDIEDMKDEINKGKWIIIAVVLGEVAIAIIRLLGG